MITQNKRLIGIVLTVVIILLIPFIAMQFTHEVNWTASDFIVAAVLLLGTGLTGELVLRKVKKTTHRIALCAVLLAALLLIWAELAVGIFGSPFSGS
jgi:ABC-type cobalt transport system substrate-binding protein